MDILDKTLTIYQIAENINKTFRNSFRLNNITSYYLLLVFIVLIELSLKHPGPSSTALQITEQTPKHLYTLFNQSCHISNRLREKSHNSRKCNINQVLIETLEKSVRRKI